MVDRRQLELAAQAIAQHATSIRASARQFGINFNTLHRRMQLGHSLSTVPETGGRKRFFTPTEEKILDNTILEFANNDTPLSNEDIRDCVSRFVSSLPVDRQQLSPFKQNTPSSRFVTGFLKSHKELKFRRRAALEQTRHSAMSPSILASHFGRLEKFYKEYNISSPEQVFNLDESRVSTRTAARGKAKAAMNANARQNAVDIDFSANADHVTIMPVVSACGKVWTPAVVLLRTFQKYRTTTAGQYETPHSYLPFNSCVAYRSPASMTMDIFHQWSEKFIEETVGLRTSYKYILLTLDGFSGHSNYRTLEFLKQNRILVVALPSHTSHRLQVLDYSVFGPFKNAIRKGLHKRLVATRGTGRNDVYTICEIVHYAYREALTYKNITSGFHAFGLWSLQGGGIDHNVIRSSDISNREGKPSGEAALESYKELYSAVVQSRRALVSDRAILRQGHLNTEHGLLMTGEDVIRALRERDAERLQREEKQGYRATARELQGEARRQQDLDREQARAARVAEREQTRLERERAAEERRKEAEILRLQKEVEKAERGKRAFDRKQRLELEKAGREAHVQWLQGRGPRWRLLEQSRALRRSTARLRFGSGVAANCVPDPRNN